MQQACGEHSEAHDRLSTLHLMDDKTGHSALPERTSRETT